MCPMKAKQEKWVRQVFNITSVLHGHNSKQWLQPRVEEHLKLPQSQLWARGEVSLHHCPRA